MNNDKFQNNETNLILCTHETGGCGNDLHDLHGKPRVALISPSFSILELKQTTGRIHRVGAKTPSLQRIIYCANTCEEVICNRLNEKNDFLDKLNDDDLVRIE